jgi:hypothetical protein
MTRDELIADIGVLIADVFLDGAPQPTPTTGFAVSTDRVARAVVNHLETAGWRHVPDRLVQEAAAAYRLTRGGVIQGEYRRGYAHALDNVHRWLDPEI